MESQVGGEVGGGVGGELGRGEVGGGVGGESRLDVFLGLWVAREVPHACHFNTRYKFSMNNNFLSLRYV